MQLPRYLALSVFTSGMTALAIELCASRLLGNVFGTSNLVWANIIGLILLYLTVGYFIGGRWADRSPDPLVFYGILAWAALAAGVVPVVSRPVLQAAANAVANLQAAVALGSFAAVLILFCVPVTLLGCVSPFAMRLAMREVKTAGDVSGKLYAVSTLGSIFGTFLPVLWLIPAIGTARTFLLFSALLMAVGLIGMWRSSRRAALLHAWMPLVLVLLIVFGVRGTIKDTVGQIFEKESAYNYIQVIQRGSTRYLLLNEGEGVHSIYDPNQLATYGTWDYFLSAPFFNRPPYSSAMVDSVAIVGLAAGTSARQFTAAFGPIPIDGFEIDPAILQVGRQYFDMNEPNLNPIAQDGRWGLEHSRRTYSVIVVDAYRPPYIPWQLTTQEFFEVVRQHLEPQGVLVMNIARLPDDRRLLDGIASTVHTVFPSEYVVDVPDSLNSILYATCQPTQVGNLLANRDEFLSAEPKSEGGRFLLDVLDRTVANLQSAPGPGPVFTDDWAPVEQLTNSMVIHFVLSGGLRELAPQ
ncbi:MAG: fused MFS/spermidine synthase [Anaerolineales bacterium]|jgi:predicted membrane-bound spermidine synthase